MNTYNQYDMSLELVLELYNETIIELNSVRFKTESQACDSKAYWDNRLKMALQPIDVFFPKNNLTVFRTVVPTMTWCGSYYFLKLTLEG